MKKKILTKISILFFVFMSFITGSFSSIILYTYCGVMSGQKYFLQYDRIQILFVILIILWCAVLIFSIITLVLEWVDLDESENSKIESKPNIKYQNEPEFNKIRRFGE